MLQHCRQSSGGIGPKMWCQQLVTTAPKYNMTENKFHEPSTVLRDEITLNTEIMTIQVDLPRLCRFAET